MSYFSNEFLDFLQELPNNNNRDWFKKNKNRYEDYVKIPFTQFVEELIYRIKEIEPDLETTPKESIFRIYRDIRFSKDKTPYKTNVSAIFKKGGRTSVNSPSYYFQISGDKIFLGGGVYHLDKTGLYKIRSHIANSLKEFSKIIQDKQFISAFEKIDGEKNKRIPKEFKEIHEIQPLIANKYFFYSTELIPSTIFDDNFIDLVMGYYKTGKKVNSFFKEALKITIE